MSANMYDAWDCGDRPAIRAKLKQREMNRDDLEQAIYARTRRFVDLDVLDAILELIAAEREACAKVIDDLSLAHPGRADLTALQCAAAIRERGQE
jgi:hypothetical protein